MHSFDIYVDCAFIDIGAVYTLIGKTRIEAKWEGR